MALYIALSVGPFIPSAFRNLFSKELTRIHLNWEVTNCILTLVISFSVTIAVVVYLIYAHIKPFGDYEN